jgi:dihydropteroate synthase
MFTLNGNGRLLVVDKPLVMGIINATPDSFYAESRHTETGEVLKIAEKMLAEGADILDVGGQSTRPGSERVNEEDELNRVIPLIQQIHQNFPGVFISIDTFYAGVASAAVAEGANMVNDVSAGQLDAAMLPTVASLKVPFVCMHMPGDPQTMNKNTKYENIVREILDFFIRRISDCRQAGIRDVIIDPGFGFGKTIDQNFHLIRNLSAFKICDCAILAGLSRKSTVYKTLNISPEEALNGTTALNTMALMNGADILRVHDVKEARQAATMFQRYQQA